MNESLEIEQHDLASLIPCDIEPNSRLKSVTDLIEAIQSNIEKGEPPLPKSEFLLLGSDGKIGDGHRRREALIACGVTSFWVSTDYKRTSNQILHDKASAAKHTSIQGGEMLGKMYAIGIDPVYLPRSQYSAYMRLKTMTGGNEDSCKYVVEHGRALSIYKEIERVLRFCGMQGDIEFARQACIWLIDFSRQKEVRALIESDMITPRTLKRHIKDHDDLTRM